MWQHEGSVWLLDHGCDGWVIAELRFDPNSCTFDESRRSVYAWEREAVCALLGRTLAAGDQAAAQVSMDLHRWLERTSGVAEFR